MSDGRTIAAITGAMAVPGAMVGAVIGHIASLRAQGAEQGWPVDEHGMTSIKMDDGRALRATGRGAAIGAVAGPSLMAGAVLAGHLMRKRADAPHSYYGEVLRMRPGEVLRPIGRGALGGALAGGVYDLWKQHGREGDFDYKQLAKHMGVGGAIGAGIGAIPGARRGHQIAEEQSILDEVGPFSVQSVKLQHPTAEGHGWFMSTPIDESQRANAAVLRAGVTTPSGNRLGTRGVAVNLDMTDGTTLFSMGNAPRDPTERGAWVSAARHHVDDHIDLLNRREGADNPMHEDRSIIPSHRTGWPDLVNALA